MHRADFDLGFSLAVEISAFAGQKGERLDVAPGPVGGVAVEDRCIGGIDAVNPQGVHVHAIRGDDEAKRR